MTDFISLIKDRFSPCGTYAVVTFGCQMNARDSEKLSGMLSMIGYTETDNELNADIVVFNTCTVRENANDHLYGRLGRLKKSKLSHPDRIIAVSGCMMQEEDERIKIKEKYPYVDIVFGTHNISSFPRLIYELLIRREEGKKRKMLVSVLSDSEEISENIPSKRKYPFKQGVNIMFGCNNFCTYCIVPYVRGREKSRAPEDIYDEIKRAASEGVKEIMLLGQNVNSYDGGIGFSELLYNVDLIAQSEGIERIRFMTSHPKDLTDDLIDVIAGGKKIMKQFHLPLQSGSDRILNLMNRHYTRASFIERAHTLMDKVKGISMSTDIIVGFPGESAGDFDDTLSVLSDIRFDFAYTFIYSKRRGTPAAGFKGEVAEDEIKERFSRLLKLQNAITAENLEKRVGSVEKVLFESVSEHDKTLISGKTEGGATCLVPYDISLIGEIFDVKLTGSRGFYFLGCLI